MHHVCDVDWSREYRFIYNLFNDADSNSAYGASNRKDDDEKWFGRDMEENGCNAWGLGRNVLSNFFYIRTVHRDIIKVFLFTN